MAEDPGPFDKLVGTEQEVDPQRRQLQHRRGQKAQRHRIAPHVDRVTDHAEAAVAPGAENARDQRGVDRRTHDVIRIDQQHDPQIVLAGVRQPGEGEHRPHGQQDQHPADQR